MYFRLVEVAESLPKNALDLYAQVNLLDGSAHLPDSLSNKRARQLAQHLLSHLSFIYYLPNNAFTPVYAGCCGFDAAVCFYCKRPN